VMHLVMNGDAFMYSTNSTESGSPVPMGRSPNRNQNSSTS
jgi:hypothetical protein